MRVLRGGRGGRRCRRRRRRRQAVEARVPVVWGARGRERGKAPARRHEVECLRGGQELALEVLSPSNAREAVRSHLQRLDPRLVFLHVAGGARQGEPLEWTRGRAAASGRGRRRRG